MQQHSLFSVIIPTYNREDSIADSLQSVVKQTYRPIELVIIDDGSTDNTETLISEFKQKHESDELKVYYYRKENGGVGSARNMGMSKATGEYVQFLDSDDTIHPERLSILKAEFDKSGADFIQTGFEGFDPETKEVVQTVYGRHDQNQVHIALTGYLFANTLRSAFKKSLLDILEPWNTEMSCFEDREFVERAVLQANKPIAIREILASAMRGGSERISDKLRSREGRNWRIFCEEQLAKSAKKRTDIPKHVLAQFVSRIYGLALRSNAEGWKDYGSRCQQIASEFDVKLDAKGKVRKVVSKLGVSGARLYLRLAKFKF
jgi:glycosyltransferase involved in cell wall biosynthesis